MTQTAINALCEMLASVPASDQEWKSKADIICSFAEKISTATLLRAGFQESQRNTLVWAANELVSGFPADDADFDEVPADCTMELYLNKVPSSLTAVSSSNVPNDHFLLFGSGRVLDWNVKTKKPLRTMTYEEAARLVVFWLAEKILQIVRKNEWDRVKQLPDLFDRLAGLIATKP